MELPLVSGGILDQTDGQDGSIKSLELMTSTE